MRGYFNPRSPHGERPKTPDWVLTRFVFQSTLPARGATALLVCGACIFVFQSTLPARGATKTQLTVSSHHPPFQSTLPARGATKSDIFLDPPIRQFQSTLPARGATTPQVLTQIITSNFNPRSPHGERLLHCLLLLELLHFNPRSPHGERHL